MGGERVQMGLETLAQETRADEKIRGKRLSLGSHLEEGIEDMRYKLLFILKTHRWSYPTHTL